MCMQCHMAFNEMLQPKKSVASIFVAELFHFEQNSSFVGCIHQKYIPKSFASIWYYPILFKSLTCEGKFNLIHAFCWYKTKSVSGIYTEPSTMRIRETGSEQFSNVISFCVADAIFPRRMYFFLPQGDVV